MEVEFREGAETHELKRRRRVEEEGNGGGSRFLIASVHLSTIFSL